MNIQKYKDLLPFRSLKSRLYFGSGLLVAVFLMSNLLGFVGQEVLLSNFRDNQRAEQFAADLLELDQRACELKYKSESFVQTGAESQYQSAVQIQSALLSEIDLLATKTDQAVLLDFLRRMRVHIDEFGGELAMAASERKLRTSLLQVKLVNQEIEVDSAFAEMEEALKADVVNSDSHHLISAIRLYAIGRKRLLRYFIEPDSSQYEQMLDDLANCQSNLQDIELSSIGESIEASQSAIQLKQQLLDSIEQFTSLAVRAVQATRGYLYFVNVVMAGEISEFVHYSNQLKNFVSQQKLDNKATRDRVVLRGRMTRIFVSIATVFLATALAVRLSSKLFSPISRLTTTFRRLADGETIKSIPDALRDDEIGRMAQAAEVFSRNNEQTKKLLAHSQMLSEELSLKADALEVTNRELDNFAYVASHDLKSPLRGLRSLAQWVVEDCEAILGEESKEHLLKIQGRVDKMEMLLDDLLAYSRIGRFKIDSETVNVDKMVRSLIEIIDNPNNAKVSIDGRLPILQTHRQPLQQILLNLLNNAVKYNDKGSQGRINVSSWQAGENIVFQVKDNGVGFDPKFSDRVFQMYQRVSTMKVEGSGMGLAIVKKLIQSIGGTIEVESAVGQGAIFRFTWPQTIAQSPSFETSAVAV